MYTLFVIWFLSHPGILLIRFLIADAESFPMPDTIPERAEQDIYIPRIPDAAEAFMFLGERQRLHIGIPDLSWFGTFLSLDRVVHRVSFIYMAVCCLGTANRRVVF